jgi:uncharacterized protein (DUF1501 family)
MTISRREFTRMVAGGSALAAMGQLGRTAAVAQASNYRAMVGLFLFGGNDSWNMVVPNDSRHATYLSQRGTVGMAQSALMPLSGTAFALHPSFKPLQAAWDEGALSAVLNTGTLFQPLTRALYTQRPDLRPYNLMSHSDEQDHWQGNRARDVNIDGFMGRMVDKMTVGSVPPLISLGGSNLALIGQRSSPLVLPSSGTLPRNGYNAAATDTATKSRQAALAAFADASGSGLITQQTGKALDASYAQVILANQVLSSTTSVVDQHFKNPATGQNLTSEISRQLLRVARMIEARSTLSHDRQVFFASQGGYDTHNGQVAGGTNATGYHATLYADLALAMAAFYAAMKALGMQDNVTLFTMSDFGRVFKGNAQSGTDHAWGGNHLVLGGALAGGKVHGRYPDMVFGGNEDVSNDGRWIPSIATEEYIGAVARWAGVAEADMPYVFPNWATWSGGGRGPVPLFG